MNIYVTEQLVKWA